MSANVDVSNVQERVTSGAKGARRLTHKLLLASLGTAGLTYDVGKSVVTSAGKLVQKVESRGEEIESKFNSRLAGVQEQVTQEVKAKKAKVEDRFSDITEGVSQRGRSLEKEVQKKLSSLKIGSGTVLETDQIRIEVEVIESEPWEGYDSLNAQEVIDHLSGLDTDQLEAVRSYETNTKDRVTVLREVDMRLAAIEESGPQSEEVESSSA